MNAAESFVNV